MLSLNCPYCKKWIEVAVGCQHISKRVTCRFCGATSNTGVDTLESPEGEKVKLPCLRKLQ